MAKRTFHYIDGTTFTVPEHAAITYDHDLNGWLVQWESKIVKPGAKRYRWENVIPREAVKYLQRRSDWSYLPDDEATADAA